MERAEYDKIKPPSRPLHRWYATAKTREKAVDFLLNPEAMAEYARRNGNYVNSCAPVSRRAKRDFRRMGLRARYVEVQTSTDKGYTIRNRKNFHAFVVVCDKEREREILFDAQYRDHQKSPAKEGEPANMVGAVRTEKELYYLLKKHRIDATSYHYYERIFNSTHDVIHEVKQLWRARMTKVRGSR